MASPGACPEATTIMPGWKNNSCWWLAANHVLFHKPRKEITEFLNKEVSSFPTEQQPVVPILKRMIEHFQGGGTQTVEGANAIDADRKKVEMKAYFERAENTGQYPFQIASADNQDTTEWISRLANFFPINSIKVNAENIGSIDIESQRIFFPKPILRESEKLKDSGVYEPSLSWESARYPDADFIILERTGLYEEGKVVVKNTYYKTLDKFILAVDPTVKRIEESESKAMNLFKESSLRLVEYELDGIITGKVGHFNSIVKCSTTGKWYISTNLNGEAGPLKEATLTDDDKHTKPRLCVYSRVRTVKDTVSIKPSPFHPKQLEEIEAMLKKYLSKLNKPEITAELEATSEALKKKTTVDDEYKNLLERLFNIFPKVRAEIPMPERPAVLKKPAAGAKGKASVAAAGATGTTPPAVGSPTRPGEPDPALAATANEVIPAIPTTRTDDPGEKNRLDHIHDRFIQLYIFLSGGTDRIVRIPAEKDGTRHFLGTERAAAGRSGSPEYKQMIQYIQDCMTALKRKFGDQVVFGPVGEFGVKGDGTYKGPLVTEQEKPTDTTWHVWGANAGNWFLPMGQSKGGTLGGGQASFFTKQGPGVFGINTMKEKNDLEVQIWAPYNWGDTERPNLAGEPRRPGGATGAKGRRPAEPAVGTGAPAAAAEVAAAAGPPIESLFTKEEIEGLYQGGGGSSASAATPWTLPENGFAPIQAKLDNFNAELKEKNHRIDATKYETVWVASDLHADFRKFVQMLLLSGLMRYSDDKNPYDPNTDAIYDTSFITDAQWVGGSKTLVVFIGDLVDGSRPITYSSSYNVDDRRGSFELLIHLLITQLRKQARAQGSEILFTIGNHDLYTILINDTLLDHYIHPSAIVFFGNDKGRRDILKQFYTLSPYLMLILTNTPDAEKHEIAMVHGGLHAEGEENEYIGKALETLQKELNIATDISNLLENQTHLEIKYNEGAKTSPLWTRFYATNYDAKKSYDENKVCTKIQESPFTMILVGHCPTGDQGAYRNIYPNPSSEKYAYCDGQGHHVNGYPKKIEKATRSKGCVVLGCENDSGPHFALVDTMLSQGFRELHHPDRPTERPNGLRPIEMLRLTHTEPSGGERFYDTIDRVELLPELEEKQYAIPMWPKKV